MTMIGASYFFDQQNLKNEMVKTLSANTLPDMVKMKYQKQAPLW